MSSLIFKMVKGDVVSVHFMSTTRTSVEKLKSDVLEYVSNGKLKLEEDKLYYVDDTDFCEVVKNDVESDSEICCMIDGVEYGLPCIDFD